MSAAIEPAEFDIVDAAPKATVAKGPREQHRKVDPPPVAEATPEPDTADEVRTYEAPRLTSLVYYNGRATKDQPRAALVASVNNLGGQGETVDLVVFSPGGSTYGARAVSHRGSEPVGAEASWYWPEEA